MRPAPLRLVYCLLLALLLPAAAQAQGFSLAAEKYFDAAFALLRQHSYHRRQIDWLKLEQDVKGRAFQVATIPETYPLLRLAVAGLHDRHSSFIPPADRETALISPARPAARPAPDTLDGPANVGYLRVPAFRGSDEQARDYVAALRAEIKRQDQPGLRGWVVDLRGNRGGNMWPMLAALEPLLSEGPLGYFADADGAFNAWGRRRGRAFLGRRQFGPATPAYRLQAGPAVVAVLTDARTASSGEAVAVALRGQPGTRSFGQPTYGVPSANNSYPLADGALLNITTAAFADRTRHVYDGPLPPDEPTASAVTLRRAVEWVRAQGLR